MKTEQLQEMLEIHGIRGVIDMISAICKDNAKQGKTMAYNSEKDYNLLPDTLLQIADNLDKDLW